MNIVVTFYVDNKDRHIITDALKNKAEIIFLKDIEKESRHEALKNADILLAWNISKELNDAGEESFRRLKYIQLISAGYDHLNFDIFPGACLIAANQGAYAEPMAEHTVAMILALSKRLLINHKKLILGEFDQDTQSKSLRNSVTGIIGFGGIGKSTAVLLKNFGSKILAINTSGRTDETVDFIGTLNDLDYVLSKSDIVILPVPLNDSTRGLIGKHELEIMKHDAILINIARGDIIVEKDLYDHLKSNPEFSAGIDAWWVEPFKSGEFRLNYPFLDLPNVIGSPHNSALIPGALIDGQKRAAENILNFIEKRSVRGIVNRE